MINKTNLFRVIMFFTTIFLIYGLLVIFDYFFHLYQYKNYRLSNEIITDRKKNEDRKYLLEAKKNGYELIIYPYLYADNNYLKKFSKNLDIIPINAQPLTKVYYCNEGYGLIKFKTDRLGFRNNDLIWDRLNNLEKKIVFIGDSYTQGACVKENETISSHFNDYITYNLGLDGNNPATYSSLSKLFIPKIKPKFVIQLFYVNDFTEVHGILFQKNLRIKGLEKKYFKNQPRLELSDDVLNSINNAKKIINKIKPLQPGERKNIFLRGIRYLSLPTTRKYISVIYNKYFFKLSSSAKNSINILKQTCINNNCEPIIGFIPNSSYWEPNPLTEVFRKEIKKYTSKVNIKFIDFTDEIKFQGATAYAPKGTHMSPIGYKIIADKIKKTLIEFD